MIRDSYWKLSKLRIADLGYVPELEPVLLADGNIAKLKRIDPGGFVVWDIFDTDLLVWVETKDIKIEEVAGVIIPSYIETITEFEEGIIEEFIKAKIERDRPYLIVAKGPEVLVTISRLRQEAQKRIDKTG